VSDTNRYADFAQFEREFWDKTGPIYSDGFVPVTSQTVPALLRQLQLSPAATLLDVACGPGLITAALRASDPGVTVIGADLSTEMLKVARTLNPGARFEQADAENLSANEGPFEESSVDAVSCNFGVLHFGNPPAAMRSAVRVLKSGGRYAFTVWDTPERNRAMAIIMSAVKPYAAQTVMPEGPPFFHYSDRAVSRQALEDAGLVDVVSEDIPMTWPIASAASFIRFFRDGGARIGEILRQLSPEAARQVEETIAGALAEYGAPGRYAAPTAAVVFSGRKP
jgi:ubiquinone/menaquinone biosynthesis C-methylase UbiE